MKYTLTQIRVNLAMENENNGKLKNYDRRR
jgi:hypothetical protein